MLSGLPRLKKRTDTTGLRTIEFPTDGVKAADPHHSAKPVGDARGYEGMGRNSDEIGVSADTFILTHRIPPTAIRGKPAAAVSARISLNRAHRTASNACSSE